MCNAPPSEPPKEKTVGFPALKGLTKDYKLKVAYVEIIYEDASIRYVKINVLRPIRQLVVN